MGVIVYQPHGLAHCKYIRKMAMRIWRDLGYERGLWEECLKEAMKNHRIYLNQGSIPITEKKPKGNTWYRDEKKGWIQL